MAMLGDNGVVVKIEADTSGYDAKIRAMAKTTTDAVSAENAAWTDLINKTKSGIAAKDAAADAARRFAPAAAQSAAAVEANTGGYRRFAAAATSTSSALLGMLGIQDRTTYRLQLMAYQGANMAEALSGVGGTVATVASRFATFMPIVAAVGGVVGLAVVAWQKFTGAAEESGKATKKAAEEILTYTSALEKFRAEADKGRVGGEAQIRLREKETQAQQQALGVAIEVAAANRIDIANAHPRAAAMDVVARLTRMQSGNLRLLADTSGYAGEQTALMTAAIRLYQDALARPKQGGDTKRVIAETVEVSDAVKAAAAAYRKQTEAIRELQSAMAGVDRGSREALMTGATRGADLDSFLARGETEAMRAGAAAELRREWQETDRAATQAYVASQRSAAQEQFAIQSEESAGNLRTAQALRDLAGARREAAAMEAAGDPGGAETKRLTAQAAVEKAKALDQETKALHANIKAQTQAAIAGTLMAASSGGGLKAGMEFLAGMAKGQMMMAAATAITSMIPVPFLFNPPAAAAAAGAAAAWGALYAFASAASGGGGGGGGGFGVSAPGAGGSTVSAGTGGAFGSAGGGGGGGGATTTYNVTITVPPGGLIEAGRAYESIINASRNEDGRRRLG